MYNKLLTKVRYPDMDIVWSLMLWKKYLFFVIQKYYLVMT